MKLLRLAQLAAVLSPVLAGGGVPDDPRCSEAHADCKEDCSIEFGTSLKTREKLGVCLVRCDRSEDECRGRHFERTRNSLERKATQPKPSEKEPSPAPEPAEEADTDSWAPGEYVPPSPPPKKKEVAPAPPGKSVAPEVR